MSAYLVDKKHIDALLTWGLFYRANSYGPITWGDGKVPETAYARGEVWGPGVGLTTFHKLTSETANCTGQILWDQNTKSVNYRHGETEPAENYIYEKYHRMLKPVEVLRAIDCYEYQSCENPGWPESEAWQICQAIKHRAIGSLPGYENAEWDITE